MRMVAALAVFAILSRIPALLPAAPGPIAQEAIRRVEQRIQADAAEQLAADLAAARLAAADAAADRIQAGLVDMGDAFSAARAQLLAHHVYLRQPELAEMMATFEQHGLPADLGAHAFHEAVRWGVPPLLVLAVIEHETGGTWRVDLRGRDGEWGLMQVMPVTAHWIAGQLGHRDFDERALADPWLNLRFGTFFLGALYQDTGDWVETLRRYNAGQDWMVRAPALARDYSARVLAVWREDD